MRHRFTAIAVAAIIAVSGTLAVGATPASASPGAGKKVAIIVGPTGSLTASFRQQGDQAAAAATATGATVVKVYSPNATWANVKAAVNGAHVIVYLGHGNGFPNPYTSGVQYTDRVNGWGLNTSTTNGDADSGGALVYCGEKALAGTLSSSDGASQRLYCGFNNGTQGITPAPGFVMIYAGACYAPGASESWDSVATESVALQRVSNFSRAVLNLGAAGYFATYHGAAPLVDRVLRNPTMTFGQIYDSARPAGTMTDHAHLSVSGARAWLMRTSMSQVYTYAFAGNPARTPSGQSSTSSLTVERWSGGSNRYDAAAALSAASYAPNVSRVYVATGVNFPDALAGGPVAAARGAPILLVTRDAVPPATATELNRLKPGSIVILGGLNSVGAAVAEQLRAYTSGSVSRIDGADRFVGAAAISASHFAPGVQTAYVATGLNYPDALAGVSPAAQAGAPILLVRPDAIPPATAVELNRLKPGRIVILGGVNSVNQTVANQLNAYTAGSVSRLDGTDRFDGAVSISAATNSTAATVFITTGLDFPDALTGGPVAAREAAPLLLVRPTLLPPVVADELRRLRPARVIILGGPLSVSPAVVDQIRALFP